LVAFGSRRWISLLEVAAVERQIAMLGHPGELVEEEKSAVRAEAISAS
jgi:hypothetical protein